VAGVTVFWATRPEPPAPVGSGEFMQAIVHHEYGPPDVLKLERIERWLPQPHQVVVKVHAAAANPLDWHYIRGTPYVIRLESGFSRPTDGRAGADFAGEVVQVGADVKDLRPGQRVYGVGPGAFAEYVVASARRVAPMPDGIGFEQAAAVPVAGLTALQGLRDQGRIQAGQKVLVNGASGGVGTFAVQIAKAYGAEVTAVCSTRNVDLVRSLGADHVVDYTREDYTRGEARYDLILDNVGNRSLLENRRVMSRDGVYVLIGGGGPDAGNWIGPLAGPVKAFLLSPFVSQEFTGMMASVGRDDLLAMNRLIEEKKVTPVIDRSFALADAPEAIRYLETGRARGKVIVDLDAGD
jgi:NADPH:quinone reductase-like Zn-dependent oxidoreductase